MDWDSSLPVPLISLLLLPHSSSDLERVAGMRLSSGCSCTEGVPRGKSALGLVVSDDCELAFSAGVCGGSESLVGCERVDESMVTTVVIKQGQLWGVIEPVRCLERRAALVRAMRYIGSAVRWW